MTVDGAIDLLRNAIFIAAQAAGPLLAAALIVGLAVGILQTATQVNEASISFLAKLIAIGLTLTLIGPDVLVRLVDYTHRSFAGIAQVLQ